MIGAMRGPTVFDATPEIMSRIERIERALDRLPEGPERGTLCNGGKASRPRSAGTAERDRRLDPHHLRIDAAASCTVARAVDVFDRKVRALTRVIETYTAESAR